MVQDLTKEEIADLQKEIDWVLEGNKDFDKFQLRLAEHIRLNRPSWKQIFKDFFKRNK